MSLVIARGRIETFAKPSQDLFNSRRPGNRKMMDLNSLNQSIILQGAYFLGLTPGVARILSV